MLGLPLASEGRTGHPRGSQALLSPVLKRLTPTAIPVSDTPAMAKGSKCLGKTAGCRRVRPIISSYVTHTQTSASRKTTPEPLRVVAALPLSPRRSFASRLVARLPLTKQLTNDHYLYWFVHHPEFGTRDTVAWSTFFKTFGARL